MMYIHFLGDILFLSVLTEFAHGEEEEPGQAKLNEFKPSQAKFLNIYKNAIQDFIMTGHEIGWKHCDILSHYSTPHKNEPHISIDLDMIHTLKLKKTFMSSSCLLVNYNIGSKSSLEKLIKFGREAIQHIRLALVVKMDNDFTLDIITNITNLPFLIAADLKKEGKEQFLCPIVGKMNPIIQENMCNPSYVSYGDKILRVALLGIPPNFLVTNTGKIDGIDIRLMRLLEQKLNFRGKIVVPQSFLDSESKVCSFTLPSNYKHLYIFSQKREILT